MSKKTAPAKKPAATPAETVDAPAVVDAAPVAEIKGPKRKYTLLTPVKFLDGIKGEGEEVSLTAADADELLGLGAIAK